MNRLVIVFLLIVAVLMIGCSNDRVTGQYNPIAYGSFAVDSTLVDVVSDASGNIYVLNLGGTVYKFSLTDPQTPTWTQVKTWSTSQALATGLVFLNDELFVFGGLGSPSMKKYTPAGTYITSQSLSAVGFSVYNPETDGSYIYAGVTDPNDFLKHGLVKLSSYGGLVDTLKSFGSNSYEPLAADTSELWYNERGDTITLNAINTGTRTSVVSVDVTNNLIYIDGTFDKHGNLYVVGYSTLGSSDTTEQAYFVYDAAGNQISSYTLGYRPYSIHIDSRGLLFVGAANKVYVYNLYYSVPSPTVRTTAAQTGTADGGGAGYLTGIPGYEFTILLLALAVAYAVRRQRR